MEDDESAMDSLQGLLLTSEVVKQEQIIIGKDINDIRPQLKALSEAPRDLIVLSDGKNSNVGFPALFTYLNQLITQGKIAQKMVVANFSGDFASSICNKLVAIDNTNTISEDEIQSS